MDKIFEKFYGYNHKSNNQNASINFQNYSPNPSTAFSNEKSDEKQKIMDRKNKGYSSMQNIFFDSISPEKKPKFNDGNYAQYILSNQVKSKPNLKLIDKQKLISINKPNHLRLKDSPKIKHKDENNKNPMKELERIKNEILKELTDLKVNKSYDVDNVMKELKSLKKSMRKSSSGINNQNDVEILSENIEKMKRDLEKQIHSNNKENEKKFNLLHRDFSDFKEFAQEKIELLGKNSFIFENPVNKIPERKELKFEKVENLEFVKLEKQRKNKSIEINIPRRKATNILKEIRLSKIVNKSFYGLKRDNRFPKLRIYVLSLILIFRIKIKLKYEFDISNDKGYQWMIENFAGYENQFKIYIYEGFKQFYYSIPNEDLEVSDKLVFSYKGKNSNETKFKKIEKLIFSFINTLNLLFEPSKIMKFIVFLSRISNEKSTIPEKFFTYFENLRIQFENFIQLKEMTVEKRSMILNIFIILKCIVFDIFIKNKFAKANLNHGSKRKYT